MTRDPLAYIEDILASIGRIEEYIKGLDEQRFLENTQIQDAILRRLEVIGEAVQDIPESIRNRYAEIPWRNMAGLREVLIHQYFGVNLHRTWLVVTEDIPTLKVRLIRVHQDLHDSTNERES